jgi:hypothetical protein
MPTELRGAIEARKALKKFEPDLAKSIQKEMATLLKPIAKTAQGFIPSTVLSGWSKPLSSEAINYRPFPKFDLSAAKKGIGYRTSPSKPNKNGFRALARIVNTSAAGTIYETSGRKNPQGRPQSNTKDSSQSLNPNAGKQFIDALDATGRIVDANNMTGAGRRSNKMKGRAIYRAWAEDGGKTNAAVLKSIQKTKDLFNKNMAQVR